MGHDRCMETAPHRHKGHPHGKHRQCVPHVKPRRTAFVGQNPVHHARLLGNQGFRHIVSVITVKGSAGRRLVKLKSQNDQKKSPLNALLPGHFPESLRESDTIVICISSSSEQQSRIALFRVPIPQQYSQNRAQNRDHRKPDGGLPKIIILHPQNRRDREQPINRPHHKISRQQNESRTPLVRCRKVRGYQSDTKRNDPQPENQTNDRCHDNSFLMLILRPVYYHL